MQPTVPKYKLTEERIQSLKLLNRGKNGDVRELSKIEVLKIVSPRLLELSGQYSIYSKSIIERNVLYAHVYEYPEEFYLPTGAVYTEDGFVGYTQEYSMGIDIIDYYRSFLRNRGTYTFNGLLKPYKQLNEALKKAPHVVCPDLASGGNVLVDYFDNVALTDFTGLQIANRPTTDISCYLISPYRHIQDEVQEALEDSKYIKSGYLYTKELDKRSILLMLLRDILNLNVPTLEFRTRVFPFELRKKALLLLRLQIELHAEKFANRFAGENLESLIASTKEELDALHNQSDKTDYEYFKRILNMAGVEDTSHLMQALLKMSDEDSENMWLDNIIDELESGYILESQGRVRRLIRK